MHYYPHHIGDYERDTASLTLMEHGAYGKLMRSYYATEKPLPNDDPTLWRICGAMDKTERTAVSTVARRFFTLGADGQLHQKRIDEELGVYQAMVVGGSKGGRKASENRRLKAQAKSPSKAPPLAPGVVPPLPSPLPEGYQAQAKATPQPSPTNHDPGTMNQKIPSESTPLVPKGTGTDQGNPSGKQQGPQPEAPSHSHSLPQASQLPPSRSPSPAPLAPPSQSQPQSPPPTPQQVSPQPTPTPPPPHSDPAAAATAVTDEDPGEDSIFGSPEFEEFWAAYPRKAGKGNAWRAWRRIRQRGDILPPLSTLLSALQQQQTSEHWRRSHGQFIPSPSTWLNQHRWLDDLSPPRLLANPADTF